MFKSVLIYVVVLQCLVIDNCWSKPTKRTTDVDQNFNSTQLIKSVREMIKQPAKFRRMATISLLTGAIRTEERMEKELTKLVDDFLLHFNDTTAKAKEKKLKEISRFVQRDLRAMFILSSAIDLTHYNASFEEFRNSMKEYTIHGEELSPQLDRNLLRSNENPEKTIRKFIDEHIRILRRSLMNRVSDSIGSMQKEDKFPDSGMKVIPIGPLPSPEVIGMNSVSLEEGSLKQSIQKDKKEKSKGKGKSAENHRNNPQNMASELTDVYYIPYQEEILNHLRHLDRQTRQNGDMADSEDEDFDPNDEQPGGLVGLIANLSGGEEGSDVAAVIGALAGVVSNIFGPGGLDINSLLSTGTSLIAGLLGGDENFGKVLGTYVGTAIDGFSGGGGADLNGLFVGNLIGGALSGLSADPDDEDENHIKPGTFLRNAFTGFFQPLARPKNGPAGGDARQDQQTDRDDDMVMNHGKGSDIIGFIFGTVKAIVGGVVNIVFQTLGGLSNGALKGTMQLSNKVADKVFDGLDDFASVAT